MKVGNTNVIFNKVTSNEEHSKIHIRTQFNNKITFMDSIIVEGVVVVTFNKDLSNEENPKIHIKIQVKHESTTQLHLRI